MKLRFSIHYSTAWGESLHAVVTYKSRDGRERTHNLAMQTQDGELWAVETAVMESRQHPVETFSYYYQVENGEGEVLRREWNHVRREYVFDSTKDYILPDQWRDVPLQWHLYTKAVRNQPEGEPLPAELAPDIVPERLRLPLYRKTVIFQVSAPQLSAGEWLGVCGSHPSLGDWSPSRYLRMEPVGRSDWMLSVDVTHVSFPIAYKYVIIDAQTRQLKAWEEGDNRLLTLADVPAAAHPGTAGQEAALQNGQVLVAYGETLRVKEAVWRAAGVVVPLFSLRSEHSYGVGDLGDLLRMIDWAAEAGMSMIQLLPLNDTTSTHSWTDSHPYNGISVFALHPHYLDLEQVGELPEPRMNAFLRQQRELNALDYSDYLAVDRVKTAYIDAVFEETGADIAATDDFRQFVSSQREWLAPYAAFCLLRDRYHTSRFADWEMYATYNQDAVERLLAANEADFLRICFVQYHLHRQLSRAAAYARQKGVVLKGDVPVGVYRDSVETWQHPEYFRMDMQMGTPPSAYEPQGQNWGFPTYTWSDACVAWLRRRFRHMEQYYGAVRIDHVVSFFRTWEIPVGELFGTMGHFAPGLPLSEDEIGSFGLVFRKELFTRPFVNDQMLERIFGIHAQYVREHFLVRKSYNLYELKDEYATQARVRDHFGGRNDENSLWIRDGLYRLCADVLFLEDQRQPGMYHPRFGVFNEPVYEMLSAEEKDAFMRLYNNYFYERHNGYWGMLAQRKLAEVLSETRMLVCAEDLGLLPSCVASVLDARRILSLEVQTLPKQYGTEFAHLEANPYRSVATISTHDMAPMRLWWEEDPGRVQRYYASMLQKEGRVPRHLPPHIAEEIIARHLYCPSMLCLLSIQDWLAMDAGLRAKDVYGERINAPYDSYNQWKYRMNVTIEQLMAAGQFNQKLRTMIVRSKRKPIDRHEGV